MARWTASLLAIAAIVGRARGGGGGGDIPPLYNSCQDEAPNCARRVQEVRESLLLKR